MYTRSHTGGPRLHVDYSSMPELPWEQFLSEYQPLENSEPSLLGLQNAGRSIVFGTSTAEMRRVNLHNPEFVWSYVVTRTGSLVVPGRQAGAHGYILATTRPHDPNVAYRVPVPVWA